jgi:hypothetical protein
MAVQVSVDVNNQFRYLVNVKENCERPTHTLCEYLIEVVRRYLTLMFSVHFERDLLIYIMRQGSHNLHSIIYALHIWVSYCAFIHELINVVFFKAVYLNYISLTCHRVIIGNETGISHSLHILAVSSRK